MKTKTLRVRGLSFFAFALSPVIAEGAVALEAAVDAGESPGPAATVHLNGVEHRQATDYSLNEKEAAEEVIGDEDSHDHHQRRLRSPAIEEARPRFAEIIPEKRIVGGVRATRSYPSFASMRGCKRRFGSWACCGGEESNFCWGGCGGTLISKRHVLTAGHCLNYGLEEKFDLKGFRVGAECQGYGCSDDAEFGEAGWDDVEVHPKYNEDGKGMPENDVALVVLQKDISLDYAYVDTGPVLQDLLAETLPVLTAIGHGRTSGGGASSSTLLEANFYGLPESICEREYPTNYDGLSGDRTMFCAGQFDYDQPQTSTCGGDSGGPCYSLNAQANGRIVGLAPEDVPVALVGVVSWGKKSCEGGHQSPSVFARTSTMVEWFGPKVCNYFMYKKDRPRWCDVCDGGGSVQGSMPGWCDEVDPPVVQVAPPAKAMAATMTTTAMPNATTTTLTPNITTASKDGSAASSTTATTQTGPTDNTVMNKNDCQLERILRFCTFRSAFCSCGYIMDLEDPMERDNACSFSRAAAICTLTCKEKKCSGTA